MTRLGDATIEYQHAVEHERTAWEAMKLARELLNQANRALGEARTELLDAHREAMQK